MKKRYLYVIILKQLKWNLIWGQSSIGLLKALFMPWRYRAWWIKEITKTYRDNMDDGMAFYDTLEGLPKLLDCLPEKKYNPVDLSYHL